ASYHNVNVTIPTKTFIKSSTLTINSNVETSNDILVNTDTKNNMSSDSGDNFSHQSILDEAPVAVNQLQISNDFHEFAHREYDLMQGEEKVLSFLPKKESTMKRYVSSYKLSFKSKLGAF